MNDKAVRPTANRIWIELDKPLNQRHADMQCRLANAMLAKIGDFGEWQFYFTPDDGYCWGGNNGYENLTDNGRWFSLDFMAR